MIGCTNSRFRILEKLTSEMPIAHEPENTGIVRFAALKPAGSFIHRIVRELAVLVLLLATAPFAQAQSVVWSPLYAKPPYDRLEWTLTVLELSNRKSFYYWAFQDGFDGGGLFYFGLQPYGACPGGRNCKLALFSFFGKGATSSSKNCRAGADNGAGMSCHIRYDWRFGVPYRFAIQLAARDLKSGTETWTGTVSDANSGRTTEIGAWTFPSQNQAPPGLILGQPVSFVEYYVTPKGGCTSQPYSKVEMSVPTGFHDGTAEHGGLHSTTPSKRCPGLARFTPQPDTDSPSSLVIETGYK